MIGLPQRSSRGDCFKSGRSPGMTGMVKFSGAGPRGSRKVWGRRMEPAQARTRGTQEHVWEFEDSGAIGRVAR
jgi:hypothetical protein